MLRLSDLKKWYPHLSLLLSIFWRLIPAALTSGLDDVTKCRGRLPTPHPPRGWLGILWKALQIFSKIPEFACISVAKKIEGIWRDQGLLPGFLENMEKSDGHFCESLGARVNYELWSSFHVLYHDDSPWNWRPNDPPGTRPLSCGTAGPLDPHLSQLNMSWVAQAVLSEKVKRSWHGLGRWEPRE